MTTIDDTGFIRTRLDERLADLEDDFRTIFGADIDLSPESPDGQLIGIFGEMIADVDELAEAVYNGRSPAGARGAGLARLVRLNGLTKKGAQYSTAPITLGGTPGTIVPAGSLIASDDPAETDSVFETTTSLTIGGAGTITGSVRATATGPVPAGAHNLTVIQTVISGWASADNATAATLGSAAETDPALRIRRAASVALPSQGILDGLYAAILELDNVAHVKVAENPTDVIDANGLPRHSIHVIVDGGDPADIAAAIWLKKSSGVTQVGAEEVVITDAQGVPQTMRFDRPVLWPISIAIELSILPSPATVTIIKNAIVDWGNANNTIGGGLIWSQLFIPINSIPGLSVVNLYVGGLQENIVLPYNYLIEWLTTNIAIYQAP